MLKFCHLIIQLTPKTLDKTSLHRIFLGIILLQKLDARPIARGGLNWETSFNLGKVLGVCKSLELRPR